MEAYSVKTYFPSKLLTTPRVCCMSRNENELRRSSLGVCSDYKEQ